MQGLIACLLILGLISPCLCLRWNVGSENTFNVMEYGAHGDGKSDDSQAFLRAWQSTCGAEGKATLVIPHGKTFMLRNINLYGTCKATSIYIQLLGEIVAPAMDAWVGDRSVNWIEIAYVNNLTIDGEGLIDGHGSTWWQKCRSCKRPAALHFHSCNDLTVGYLNIINSPGIHISINDCEGARLFHINIRAPSLSPNTDGIDISYSKNILIEDSTIGTGDDCIAINGGCSYINVSGVACGPGHGISIGSLGENKAYETVEEVYVRNCSFLETQNGARIKTFQGGSGYARKITFEQITLIRARNPIYIHQHYTSAHPIMDAVEVSDVTYRGFQGTSADDNAIILDCCSSGCFNLVFDQINIVSSQPGKKAHASCHNAHGTVGSSIPNVPCLLK